MNKKLFNLKKNEKNNQNHIQSLTKELNSEDNYKKFKSQKLHHTNTESLTKQKLPSTVINGPTDNNIISINLNILSKEKKILHNNKNNMTDIKLTTSKNIFKSPLSPNYNMNSKILKKKTNYNKNKTKEKNINNKVNKGIKENINESINSNKMNYSMNSSLNKKIFSTNNSNIINNIENKNSGLKKIINDQSIQELDTEENDIINISGKNKNNISNISNSNENNKISIKDKTGNNINNINVNINYNNSNSPKNKKNMKINENSF